MSASAAGITDGRVLRGERTRASIVQALLDLLNDGVAAPTTATIAERAGVSVRSVFQHFDDLESLYADLAAEQGRRVEPLVQSLAPGGTLDDRIDAMVTQRRDLYETISPVRHAIRARAADSPALSQRLSQLSSALRSQVELHYAVELAAIGGERRRVVVDAVDLLCSFEAWDRLRVEQGATAEHAAAVLRDGLQRLLSPPR